jgi:acetone carboxylase gamma subunit
MTTFALGDALEAAPGPDGHVVRCTRCGHVYGPVTENHKLAAKLERSSVQEVPGVGDPARYGLDDTLEFRRFYCPGCGVQIETELARPDEPVRWDVQLDLGED